MNSQTKEVDSYEIHYNQVVGEGVYAKVYACSKQNIVLPLCAKEIILENVSPQDREILDRETEIMQKLLNSNCDHPNIIKIFHVAEKDNCHYIIMEKCLQGNLEKIIQIQKSNRIPFSATDVINILKQIVNGYKFLYDRQIIHRDIKPENLLMGNDGKLKVNCSLKQISDFAMSKALNTIEKQKFMTQIETPIYASPQVLTDGINQNLRVCNYSSKTDVYSIGVLIYYMIYMKYPFNPKSLHPLHGLINILQNDLKQKGIEIPKPMPISGTPEQLKLLEEFLKGTITFTEQDRLDWPYLFKTFLPNQVSFSTSLPQLRNENQQNPQQPLTCSETNCSHNKKSIEKSQQVSNLLTNLESRINLAKNVLVYLSYFKSKFQKNCNQFDYDFLSTTLLGYQFLLNQNLIGLIDQDSKSISKIITQKLLECNNHFDFDAYLQDESSKSSEQRRKIKNQQQEIKISYQEARTRLLSREQLMNDNDLTNFRAFLESQSLDYTIFSTWFRHYFHKNFYNRFKDTIAQIQDIDTLMFLAYSVKLISVEQVFPFQNFLHHNQLDIFTLEPDADTLKVYIKNIQQ